MRVAVRHRPGWYAARAAVPLLVVGQLLVAAPRAHAAATPWRFTARAAASFNIAAGTIGSGLVECPVSYVPVGGGLRQVTTTSGQPSTEWERVAEYWDGSRGFRLLVHNYASQVLSAQIWANCALATHVGSIETVSTDFGRVGSFAGGTVNCPNGKLAIGGGADWNITGVTTRRIDLTSPTQNGLGFYATGESPDAVTLHVEAYCVLASDVGVIPISTPQSYGGATDTFGTHQCPDGYHVGSGGVIASAAGSDTPTPHTYRGHNLHSYPSTPSSWASKTHVAIGSTQLRFVTWCIPASIPVVTITQAPPALTNSTSATFAFDATDPAGEPIEATCSVDEGTLYLNDCPIGSPFTLPGIPDGTHTFTAFVMNVSGQLGEDSHTWTVDTVPPDATGPAAGASVSGPLTVSFSEAVTGVSTSSVQVRVAGQTATVPGTVTTGSGGTKALWVPSSALVPGETYTVSVTSAIKDLAGNALDPELFNVRTSRVVENTSAALAEFWDRDSSGSASGGAYAASNAAGSTATWRVTATSGQTAALYGARQPAGGYGEVWVDGVKKATVSFYGASAAWKVKLFTTSALSAGAHTIQLKVLGTKPSAATGTYAFPDYLTIGSSVLQETSARHVFRRLSSASAAGGSYDVVTHKTSGDTLTTPSYSLTFRGTSVNLYVTRWSGAGPVRIYLDGVLKKTVTLTSASTLYKQRVYSAGGLTNARHTLKVVAVGTSGGSASGVAVDYVSIT